MNKKKKALKQPNAYLDHLGIMQHFWGLDEAAVASVPHVTKPLARYTVMAAFTYGITPLSPTVEPVSFVQQRTTCSQSDSGLGFLPANLRNSMVPL